MTTNRKTSALIDAFTNYLRECNMRITSERLAIIEIMSKLPALFSADDLFYEIEHEAFPISLATVYNTLQLLTDAGLVKSVRLPDRQCAVYKINTPGSLHIYYICEQCGKIRQGTARDLASMLGCHDFRTFEPRSFDLNVYGLCRKCAKSRKKMS